MRLTITGVAGRAAASPGSGVVAQDGAEVERVDGVALGEPLPQIQRHEERLIDQVRKVIGHEGRFRVNNQLSYRTKHLFFRQALLVFLQEAETYAPGSS